MFLASTSRLYARETTKEEFVRYILDNGVSASLQPALILLYKLPIKPNNLKEFFAEYMENGAWNLATISLLQAELCYLQSEYQDAQRRLSKLDKAIDTFEGILKIKGNRDLKNEIPDAPRPQEYDDKTSKLIEEQENTALALSDDRNPDLEISNVDELENFEEEIEGEDYELKIVPDPDCIPRGDSHAPGTRNEMKEFDPWGMILKFPKDGLERLQSAKKTFSEFKLKSPDAISSESTVKTKNDDIDISFRDIYDSEDADNLVNLFHTKIISDVLIQENPLFKPKTGNESRLSNLMGWNVSLDCDTSSVHAKYPIMSLSNQSDYCLSDGKNNSQRNLKADKNRKENALRSISRFYAQVNSDFVNDDLFKDVNKRLRRAGVPTYSIRGVQTDTLEEFEEIDGEGWEWESDDYVLDSLSQNQCMIKNEVNNALLPTNNDLTNIGSPNKDPTITNSENDNVDNKTNKDAAPESQTEKPLQAATDKDGEVNLPVHSLKPPKKTGDLRAVDVSLDPCQTLDPVENTNQLKSNKKYPQKFKGIQNTKSPQQANVVKIKPEYIGFPVAPSGGFRKSSKLVKYMHDVYDNEYAMKLQHEFDFRIFD